MTEDRQADATAGTNGATGDAVAPSGAQSVEEAEAIWRNRLSGKDRAHNAETQALRDQIEALKAQPVPAPSGESPEAARVRVLEQELQTERARATAATLRATYPYAAEVLGDEIASLPVERVAAINALADSGGAPRIEPNAAPRRSPGLPGGQGEKPLNEKTKDELLADLRRAAPTIQAEAREGRF